MNAIATRRVLWTAADAAAATGGRATGVWSATGVSIDSRSVAPGDLFVALRGPNFDGHDFVAAALAAGAAAAVVSRPPAGAPADAPLLAVEDTLSALQDLGRFARLRAKAKVVAVTGSVGKTTTKEALRLCLGALGDAYANVGSFNNHWGVPVSLARLPADADFGVFELGMNHAGEIGPLSRQVKPDVSVITTVEAVHLAAFDRVEAIADAKAEVFEGMDPNGTAVLSRDNPHFARLLAAARTAGLSKIWTFGASPEADARLIDCSLHATSSAVTASVRGERIQYCLALPGRHHVLNSLAVLLAVRAVGGDLAGAARALAQLSPVKGRGARRRIQLARGAFTLIDESYNASPVAMTAAFDVLSRTDPGVGGRRIAVLGDMRELGDAAGGLHAALAEPLKAAGIDKAYLVGPHMRRLWERLPAGLRGKWSETSDPMAAAVAAAVRAGDVVMVKGSLGTRMAPIVEALDALDRRADADPARPAAKSS
jgi:UDP-N-acetylmuramoyl-tripeptide--D-alanyl-D-alanine ligase